MHLAGHDYMIETFWCKMLWLMWHRYDTYKQLHTMYIIVWKTKCVSVVIAILLAVCIATP